MGAAETVEIPRPNFKDLSAVDKFWLEFNQKLYEHSYNIEYPLVNIRKRPWTHTVTNRLLGYHYNIMVSCVGFGKQELKVVIHDKVLYVSGKTADYRKEEAKEYKYIVRKIKDKDFEFNLPLTDSVKVHHVGVSNGILYITLAVGNPVFKEPTEFEIV
jgi:HSP20 family molecular chaperone IbpA